MSDKMYSLEINNMGNYVHFIVTGHDSEQTSAQYWTEIFTWTKAHNIKKILVEEALEGSTSVMDTYMFIEKLTHIIDRNFVIAFYDRFSDSINKFAETVAQNRGGRVRVFDRIDEAQTWLCNL